jgi:hypothetical protein
LINGESKPTVFPTYPCFEDADTLRPLSIGYGSFEPGEYVCDYWSSGSKIARSGINLILPSIKDLQGWWETLRLTDWLASIAEKDGFMGYMIEEDDPISMTLLHSFNGKLYFQKDKYANGLVSFSTGELLPSCQITADTTEETLPSTDNG